MCDCNCKACRMCEARESKAHERSEVGKSAFGVVHEDVSKGLIGGIKTGVQGLRFASPKAVGTAAKTGYSRGMAQGQGRMRSVLRGVNSGIMRSPGTAGAIGVGGVGAVGGTGYAAGKTRN